MRAFQHSKADDFGFNLCGIKNSLFKQILRHKSDSGAQGAAGATPAKKELGGSVPIKKRFGGNAPTKSGVELCFSKRGMDIRSNEKGRVGSYHRKKGFGALPPKGDMELCYL